MGREKVEAEEFPVLQQQAGSSGWPHHECALDDNCKSAYLVSFITKGMPLHLLRACSHFFSYALADFFCLSAYTHIQPFNLRLLLTILQLQSV